MSKFGLCPYSNNFVRGQKMIGHEQVAPIIAHPAVLDQSRFSPENRRRLSPPGLRAFLTIADLWRLTEDQRRLILGYPSRSTFQNWAKKAREHEDITLDVDVLTRISAVLGIHQALGILHADEKEGKAWLNGPHNAPLFGGQKRVELITSGSIETLLLVRRFLDAARGGLYMAPNTVDEAFVPYSDDEIVITGATFSPPPPPCLPPHPFSIPASRSLRHGYNTGRFSGYRRT